MNATKIKSGVKNRRNRGTVNHVSADSSAHARGMSPTTEGPLSAFYYADPVLSLKPVVQAKLTIGQPNDRYEQEADRVADQVMRMPEPKESLGKREKESSLVQRKSECPECKEEEEEQIQTKPLADQIIPLVQRQVEEEEEEEPVQAKPLSGSSKPSRVTTGLKSKIQSLKGSGQRLSRSVRNFFEPRFGADFGHVRVHTDMQAAETAKSINARAFTIGKDMVFGAGQYSPGTPTGKKLLGHELTHVLQQNKVLSMTIQRDLPECPGTEPGTANTTDGWCFDDYYQEGKNPWHPGAHHCYRSYNPPGQQCCYDRQGRRIVSGPGMGTPDIVGPSQGEDSDGKCVNSIPSVIGHFFTDVIPAVPGRTWRWLRNLLDSLTWRGAQLLRAIEREIMRRAMRRMFPY